VYNYETKSSRVVFGPDLVLLQPDEHFTTLNLSGDIPKKASQIQTIALFLGPDFMTDQIVVETADHARLSLKLSYNWYFDVEPDNPDQAHIVFSTPDFVGDLTKALGARVRGAVAGTTFDQFHKHSVEIIQEAVFGRNSKGELMDKLVFSSNNLVVTNIDIQSVEPVDQKTRDSLQKSVQLAIEITTKSQEATARHEAERMEQEAKGRLERQKLADEGEAERARKALLELQAESAAVESAGHATAEARAAAAAAQIEGQAAVDRANLEAKSATITAESSLSETKSRQAVQLAHRKRTDDLEVKKQRELAEIETSKFCQIVDAIGADTIQAIAQAGPEMQSKLLGSLGLKSVVITDGNSPINLFSTAGGLVGSGASHPPQ
jgi:major vault protein